jgi:hypothetical protein
MEFLISTKAVPSYSMAYSPEEVHNVFIQMWPVFCVGNGRFSLELE